MKVIDLLVKMANGEEAPYKFSYMGTNYIYDYEINDYISYGDWDGYEDFFNTHNLVSILNDELHDVIYQNGFSGIKISNNGMKIYMNGNNLFSVEEDIEEKKKIDKIDLKKAYPECEDTRFEEVQDKINEIIEVINGRD